MAERVAEREALFQRGIEAYRSGLHYEAHELWEELWQDEEDDDNRRFLQALIMVASALHKLANDVGPKGSLRLLDGAARRLEGLPDVHGGVALARFRDAIAPLREHAEGMIAAGRKGLDAARVPPLETGRNATSRSLERSTHPESPSIALAWRGRDAGADAPAASGHETFHRGVAAYHRGDYYEAHEHWEEIWRDQPDGVERSFLQGLIQVAAAMHKLLAMKGASGALRLLERARARLSAVPEGTGGLAIARLVDDCDRAHAAIARLAAEGRTDLDPALVPRITASAPRGGAAPA